MAGYMKAQQPTTDGMKTGLALFAVIIIVRFLLQKLYALARKSWQAHLHGGATVAGALDSPPRPAWTMNATDPTMKSNENSPDPFEGRAKGWEMDDDVFARTNFMSRQPPAPPLTPPELSSAVFNIAPAGPHAFDSFMRQPNPDYTNSTASAVSPLESTSSSAPRRRSYQRTMPIGIPSPRQSSKADTESAYLSPSSYPPTSPLLPPPPILEASDGPAQHQVDVKGEIISALDHKGTGWTRHTRVYGGSICLACAAAAGTQEGGFYGATVSPEEMRRDFYSSKYSDVPVQSPTNFLSK
ncbi:hypothetical protein AAL_00777 [Moelleriella libera RCEF 2490]|uniref:Uncharacterized protein n=1 Tax=Moelleriella libera RCEF 2490 TaxID=1081109 RepID=A0A166V667_9HYPO|nr:hypothetical protein AAL_00777 [Moelleriella libera RCEF 2490]